MSTATEHPNTHQAMNHHQVTSLRAASQLATSPRACRTILCGMLLACGLSAVAEAQRPRRFPRRGERPQQQAPTPAPEKKKEEENKKVEVWTAITGGDIYVGTGQVIRRGTLLIGDDKIHKIGQKLDLPEGTNVIDATGKVLSPGFIAVAGSGMGGPRGKPAKDSVNPFDPSIKQGLAAGVTSWLSGRANGRGKPDGTTAVIKCAYGDLDGMVLKEDSVKGLDLPMDLSQFAAFEESVKKAREYEQKLDEYETAAEEARTKKTDPPKKPKAPSGAEVMLDILNGKTVLWVNLGGMRGGFGRFGSSGEIEPDTANIRQAMQIAAILERGVVVRDPVCAWTIPDEIAATGSMVVWSPRTRVPKNPKKPNLTGSNLATAAILAEAGVPLAVHPPSGMFGGSGLGTGGILGQDLNTPHVDAAFAVRGGLDDRRGLRTITLDAAKILGVSDRVGSLEEGKDADVLILDGDPLHYATFVEQAFVNGKLVYEKSKERLFGHVKKGI